MACLPCPGGDRLLAARDCDASLYITQSELTQPEIKALFNSHHDPEEATQEVFVRACGSQGAPHPLSSWLYRIATNY